MATQRICSIEDCDKPTKTPRSDVCGMHYTRIRKHGDPHTVLKTKGGARRFFIDVVLPYRGDGCLFWPHSRSAQGYGFLGWNGKVRYVPRIACEIVHGPPPTSKHEAAHNCGNGHLGCCAPMHLRWATKSENQQDRKLHGTVAPMRGQSNGFSKLTPSQVREIRALATQMTVLQISRLFPVCRKSIYRIINRTAWGWLE